MSLQVKISKRINRPVADVFRFFAHDHIRNHPRWDPDMQLEQVTDGPIGVGTLIRRCVTRNGKRFEGIMEIVEFEPGRAMGVVIYDGPNEIRGRTTFEAAGKKRTTLTMGAEFADAGEGMENLVTGLMERSLRNIKDLVESEA